MESFPSHLLAAPLERPIMVKHSLSGRSNLEAFHKFLEDSRIWRAFAAYLYGPLFDGHIRRVLLDRGVQLRDGSYRARFEFSWLHRDGYVRPHTDAVQKVVSIVCPMVLEDWQPAWGGATEILEPIEGQSPVEFDRWERFRTIDSYPFQSNTANLLLRTDRSWHGVRCKANPIARRSITINLIQMEDPT